MSLAIDGGYAVLSVPLRPAGNTRSRLLARHGALDCAYQVGYGAMTIRDYLRRRRNRAVLFVLPGILFCVLSAVFTPDSFWLTWLSLAALFAGLVAVIVLLYYTPCPQCERPLGSVAARAANGWADTAHCPHCRMSLDDPLKPVNGS